MESRRIARAGRRASSAVETYPWSRVNVFALRRTNSSPFVYKVPGSSNHRRQSRRARSMRESRARARSMRAGGRIENPSRRVRTASSPSSRRDTPRRRDNPRRRGVSRKAAPIWTFGRPSSRASRRGYRVVRDRARRYSYLVYASLARRRPVRSSRHASRGDDGSRLRRFQKIVFRRYHEFSTHSRTARATVARVRAARDVHGERAIDERGVDATSRECARVRRARRGAADASPTGR